MYKCKDILGYKDRYQATSDGQIISLIGKETRILKAAKCKGYLYVNLFKNGEKKFISVHVLIALTFISERPNELVINHIDGNKLNNKASNLEYITQRENLCLGWKQKNASSQYTGVCFYRGRKKPWMSYIRINNNQKNLGYFKTEQEAFQKYQNAFKNLEGTLNV